MINSLPDISVIVCSYNHDKWLERCIRSLVHQQQIDMGEFEIIIVDDASTDSTELVMDNMRHIQNIKIIKNDINIGLPASINKAILSAKGRYIVRVDSDDYVARLFLYLSRLFLDMNRRYQAAAVDYVLVDEFENIISRASGIDDQIACGVMFRKECLFDIGLYDESFKMREGHELRKRFVSRFNLGHLEFPLYKYRKHSDNRTNNNIALDKYDRMLDSE